MTTPDQRESYERLRKMREAKRGVIGGKDMVEEYRAYERWWDELPKTTRDELAAEGETRRVKGERRQVGWRIPVLTLARLELHRANSERYPAELVTQILEKWMDDREGRVKALKDAAEDAAGTNSTIETTAPISKSWRPTTCL